MIVTSPYCAIQCVISSDVNGCPCITLFEYPKSWFIGNTLMNSVGSTNQTKNLLHLALYAALISSFNIMIIEEEWRDRSAKGWLDSWKEKASGRSGFRIWTLYPTHHAFPLKITDHHHSPLAQFLSVSLWKTSPSLSAVVAEMRKRICFWLLSKKTSFSW